MQSAQLARVRNAAYQPSPPPAGGAVGEHGRFPTADALAAHVKVQVEGWYAAFLTRAS